MSKNKFKDPNIIINKVYTKTGDRGKTSLVGGQKVSKSDLRIHAYGEVDELNSIVGIVIEELKLINHDFKHLMNVLTRVQNDLFNLGTILATKPDDLLPSMPQISSDDIKVLENEIDKLNDSLPALNSFVLPGGSRINAYLHLARTVCRRCERISCGLNEIEKLDMLVISYLNRLSDAFFVWSRWVSLVLNDEENVWRPNEGSSGT
tara:strand:- start:444 stop:1061 length:618 start_codon:yes stop_codon:yes gene_type:complete